MVHASLARKRKEKKSLSEQEIHDIKEIYYIGRCQFIPTLAKLFDVSERHIYRVLRSDPWGPVEVPADYLEKAIQKCQCTNTDA